MTDKLPCRLTDVYGRLLAEPVRVSLHNVHTGSMLHARVPHGDATILDVETGVYRAHIDPPSYRPSAAFVTVPKGVLELTFAIDPGKVTEIKAPAFAALPVEACRMLAATKALKFFENLTGEGLYTALDDLRIAGFLNIVAKAAATTFTSGRSVLSYIESLRELRRDRFFATVPQVLREETKNALGLFSEVNGSLHHPPEGFTHAGSYKTSDRYGNLQLTFFAKGEEWVADIDIDDAGGLEHVFQVVRNSLTGQPTHPYDIHQILLQHQQLDPGYSLVM